MTGIYVHIPFCTSKCGYCSFYSVGDVSTVPLYLNALEKEIDSRVTKQIKADTVYIGGGTPSVLPAGALSRIFSMLREHFILQPDSEITVEANPESCTEAFLSETVQNGVNRLSLGLQSHDVKILKQAERRHTFSDFERAVTVAYRAGISNIGADLIAGLPGQNKDSLLESLKRTVSFPAVKHISLYALTVGEDTPLYCAGYSPDGDLQADMYEESVRFLEAAGFYRYEISNFSKKGFESRHNQKYWSGEEYYGFGAAAHSFLKKDSETGAIWERIANHAHISRYNIGNFTESKEEISVSGRIEETVLLSLRTVSGLDCEKLKKETGYDILAEKASAVDALAGLGMLEVQNGFMRVKKHAFYILDSILLKLL